MCGRYTLVEPESAAERFGFVDFRDTRIVPRFNIAPSQLVLTVVGQDGRPAGRVMRWGFHPAWLSTPDLPPLTNARAETLPDRPLWRDALARARCLIPADGFYEWRTVPGRSTKEPLYIRLRSGGLFAFAGLFTRDADGTPTFAIITTTANELLAPIHERMPVLLAPGDEARWLDPAVRDPRALLAALRPFPAEALTTYPVDTLVSNVHREGPLLIEPLPEPVP